MLKHKIIGFVIVFVDNWLSKHVKKRNLFMFNVSTNSYDTLNRKKQEKILNSLYTIVSIEIMHDQPLGVIMGDYFVYVSVAGFAFDVQYA